MAALRRTTRLLQQLNAFRPISCIQSQNSFRKYTCLLKSHNTNFYLNEQLCICLFSQKSEAMWKNAEPHVDVTSGETNTENENKQDKKSNFRSKFTGKNIWKLGLAFFSVYTTGLGMFFIYNWGAPPEDAEGNQIKDEFSDLGTIQQYFRRSWKEMRKQKELIQEPSREKLLPDPLQYPYIQPPYTLVLEMTGILVHPDWTYSTGWRFKKRPGIDYFLHAVGPPMFETVVYTSETGMNADPILHSLDPQGHIMYKLYRDTTRYVNGQHIKDLSYLNRDLSKVIFIDWNPKSTELQRSNTFILKKWKGEDDDRTLIDLAHFLQAIAASNVEDVRTVLEYYSQFDDPIEKFKENQRLLQEEQERQSKLLQEKQQKPSAGGVFSGFWGRR